ncbi:ABC transporter substrate-binding protein [Corynebacterium xerosis]|uniref:ABC transporter substrate-binding protein n=1 Tax=Corynebacterium xerosis TaxID=1725 RepID=A0A7X9SVW8_9CORY|nr:ABC transporter substrate-binding protein [Corynebacterium xerosis]NMF09022.1 ABC transporter substrate-binding protein [Corynebacterium xerosis]
MHEQSRSLSRSRSQSRSPHQSPSASGPRPGSRSRSRSLLAGAAALVVSALALTGCASDGEEARGGADSGGEGNFPVSVATGPAGSGQELTLDERPERIVSLSPTATESLFAIDADDQVVAVDEYSYYPAEAPVDEGLSGYRTSVEAVLAHDPDLVVIAMEEDSLLQGMAAVDVPVLFMPPAANLDDAYAQIETLGAATGNVGGAAEVVRDMSREIGEAVQSVPAEIRDAGLSYYHEVSSDHYSITDDTFLGTVYGQFGLESIATGDAEYPQLNAEAIVGANPDLIFLANSTSESMTAEDVAARPGWSEITAVKEGRIEALDGDLASRWGPRLPEFVRSIAAVLSDAGVPAAAAN